MDAFIPGRDSVSLANSFRGCLTSSDTAADWSARRLNRKRRDQKMSNAPLLPH